MQVLHQNIGLDLYIFKTFLFLIFFLFCLLKSFIIFFSCKAANTSERSHKTWEVTSFPSGVPNLPLTTMCNSFAFSKAQFLMK